ncbi:nitrogen permease regulator family protein [Schizosaccharomyces japonicus yFS275]|uniref:Nitrogen permease regulator family protein n=1 Tax=Schizosaccharomyces japonicus (strain yFS275 / FY16936) TaxID=402676 RepID=B6K143_SCHJY|nr:nitrogen permease regulator family protein [Schizosaccharomyces japonicus yFS275]EEB07664.1 nitrogen permease regulator family protein [Schizosaccharomyces japonicus yFS275]
MDNSEAFWMDQTDSFPPRLLAIFFSLFDPLQGPWVAIESPPGSVTESDGSEGKELLVPFDSISEYVIPKPEICNKTITVATGGYRIIGHPVSLVGNHYERNALIFNMCMIFHEDENVSSYIPIVKRLSRNLKVLEQQNQYVSDLSKRPIIMSVMEQLLEDLNNFSECMIQLDPQNSINIKLFPVFPSPPTVKGFHVPILTVQLDTLMDKNWDMTIQKVYPFINGINSVQRVAELANVSFNNCCRCMEHLMYYGCLIITDIFQFHNIYAMTTNVPNLMQDPNFQKECVSYVVSGNSARVASTTFSQIFSLYTSLRHGVRVKDWMSENREKFHGLDVRRLISFGIIKGFVYRVHKYPILGKQVNTAALTPEESKLASLLDGQHHFDEICVTMKKGPKEIDLMLSKLGDTAYIYH